MNHPHSTSLHPPIITSIPASVLSCTMLSRKFKETLRKSVGGHGKAVIPARAEVASGTSLAGAVDREP
jgi:hypothetical protein